MNELLGVVTLVLVFGGALVLCWNWDKFGRGAEF